MLTYWAMFWLPLIGVLAPMPMVRSQGRMMFVSVCAVFTIFMGLRHQVGGDWYNYLPQFDYIAKLDFLDALTFKDPGYEALDWIVAQLGGSIYVVNLACASVMMVGTYRFCRSLPNPWLALLVAVPYLLIVVGMGYTRQAVAIGFAMFGLVSLSKGRTIPFVANILLGALFHSSAVLLLPIAGIASSRNRIWTVLWTAAAFVIAYFVLLEPETESLWKNYVTTEMQSVGAFERVLMNVVAAVPLLLFRKQFVKDPQARRLWIYLSLLALVCLPFVFFASTAVDRLALYLIPLQLVVFSRFPDLGHSLTARTIIVVGVVAYYGTVQYVWLNYAIQRDYWVPYHFMPM